MRHAFGSLTSEGRYQTILQSNGPANAHDDERARKMSIADDVAMSAMNS